ncbi:MAG: BatD family protein [Dysgonomonas sp.]
MILRGYSYTLKRLFVLIVLLFPLLSVAFSQDVKIRIKAPETVLTGEQFKVEYIIESGSLVEDPIIIKNMEGFTILYGPSLSTSRAVSFEKGKRVVVYISTSTYYLEAQKEGKYDLPRAEVAVNGKRYKPGAFKIEVKSTEAMTGNIDAFVRTMVSKPSVSLTDTLLLTYKLYTTKEVSRIRSAEFPYIRDFYYDNITRSRQQFAEEVIDGQTYKVADLRVLILQPRKEGRIVIPEGRIVVEYATPTGRKQRDVWGDVYDENIRTDKTLKMDSVVIRVHNLKEI